MANRQTRRAAFGAVSAGVLALSAAVVTGCAATGASPAGSPAGTPLGTGGANSAMGAIIARVQAGITGLGTLATALGANLSTTAQAAIAKAVAAASQIGGMIAGGATAVANATTSSGIGSLLAGAADAVIPLLQLVPGLGSFVTVAADIKAMVPAIVAFAQTIIDPTATSAPGSDGGAALRLGVIA